MCNYRKSYKGLKQHLFIPYELKERSFKLPFRASILFLIRFSMKNG